MFLLSIWVVLTVPEVIVDNTLSRLVVTRVLTIAVAEPSSLEISLLTPLSDLPACLPAAYHNLLTVDHNTTTGMDPDLKDPDGESVPLTVFHGIPVEFEASVDIGTNLSFMWHFRRVNPGSQMTSMGVMENGTCDSAECTSSTVVSLNPSRIRI